MARTIFVTSGKGGTGKSTVTALTGAALARQGQRVLLLELDTALRALDIMLGLDKTVVYDLSDILEGRCPPIKAVYPCYDLPNLHLIAAPGRPGTQIARAEMVRLVEKLKSCYDFILLDSPAGVGSGFGIGSAVAEEAIVVVTPDPVCIRDGRVASDLLDNYGLSRQLLVINRMGRSRKAKKLGCRLDTAIDSVGVQLLGVVPEDELVHLSVGAGRMLFANTRARAACENIAGRLLGRRIPLSV